MRHMVLRKRRQLVGEGLRISAEGIGIGRSIGSRDPVDGSREFGVETGHGGGPGGGSLLLVEHPLDHRMRSRTRLVRSRLLVEQLLHQLLLSSESSNEVAVGRCGGWFHAWEVGASFLDVFERLARIFLTVVIEDICFLILQGSTCEVGRILHV